MLKMIHETIYDEDGYGTEGPGEDALIWIGRGDVIYTAHGEQVTVIHIDLTGDVSVAPGVVRPDRDAERYPDRRYIAHHFPAIAVPGELGLFHVEDR